MLKEAVENPERLSDDYRKVWEEQFSYGDNHTEHFFLVRDRFNDGQKTPANMLYLIARCVKGSVRYGGNGKFNQSPDRRRHGTNPETLRKNVLAVSALLKGRTIFSDLDYHDVLDTVCPGDLVYMVRRIRVLRPTLVSIFSEFLSPLKKIKI
ncbi:DNA adenine methylase [Succinimonas sp.]|uniref:DNA adenine methylase n=1 Tax=Succinimonas sp. TaxID=1936151 RepID=UPI003870B256